MIYRIDKNERCREEMEGHLVFLYHLTLHLRHLLRLFHRMLWLVCMLKWNGDKWGYVSSFFAGEQMLLVAREYNSNVDTNEQKVCSKRIYPWLLTLKC